MDKYLKWIATGFLMIGAACNSLNIYPIGPIATLIGGLCGVKPHLLQLILFYLQ